MNNNTGFQFASLPIPKFLAKAVKIMAANSDIFPINRAVIVYLNANGRVTWVAGTGTPEAGLCHLTYSYQTSAYAIARGADAEAAIPAKMFRSVVDKAAFVIHVDPHQWVATITDTDECTVSVEAFDSQKHWLTVTPPDVNLIRSSVLVGEDLERFCQTAEWVCLASSGDRDRPHLTSMLTGPDKLVCTDGHRLHVGYAKTSCPDGHSVRIPAEYVGLLIELVRDEKADNVVVNWGVDGCTFIVGDYILTISQVENKFPPWEQIVPSDYHNFPLIMHVPAGTVSGRKKSLSMWQKTLTKVMKVLGANSPHSVGLSVDASKSVLCVSADSAAFNSRLSTEIPVDFDTAPPIALDESDEGDEAGKEETSSPLYGFCPRYLIEALPDGGTVFMTTDPTAGVIIEHDMGMAIVMPMRT